MKIMTILGTRPEIIRLSLVIKKLDAVCDHVLVHTGQNYDRNLSDIFFEQLNVRSPDYYFAASGSFSKQLSKILIESEKIFLKEKPNRLLILGDTNSSLCAIVAKRMGIPVYHLEAGNRCYDDRVPEEVNRRIIDHCSDVLMPYTQNSKENLLNEGIPGKRIHVIGNPILEVLNHYSPQINNSKILEHLKLKPKKYMLMTLHRAENVDIDERLGKFVEALNQIYSKYRLPIIWSVHPRTHEKLKKNCIKLAKEIITHESFGLFDFIKLEKNTRIVLTDSGTVHRRNAVYSRYRMSLYVTLPRGQRPWMLEVTSFLGCNLNQS